MSLLWHTAALGEDQRTESVAHILEHYRPTDADTWEKVHNNYNWNHPKMHAFVEDIWRNGVHTPVPINYENDPPTVENGHTRVLAAHKAGVKRVPVKDYEWFEDDEKSW